MKNRVLIIFAVSMILLGCTTFAYNRGFTFEMSYINQTEESGLAEKDDDVQLAYVRGTEVYGVSGVTDSVMLLGIRIRHYNPDYGATTYRVYQLNPHNVITNLFLSASPYEQSYLVTGIAGDDYYLRAQYDDESTAGTHYFYVEGRFCP